MGEMHSVLEGYTVSCIRVTVCVMVSYVYVIYPVTIQYIRYTWKVLSRIYRGFNKLHNHFRYERCFQTALEKSFIQASKNILVKMLFQFVCVVFLGLTPDHHLLAAICRYIT